MSVEAPTTTQDEVKDAEPIRNEDTSSDESRNESVPLKTFIKQKKRGQELEAQNRMLQEQMAQLMNQRQQAPQEDDSRYETLTKGDYDSQRNIDKEEIKRDVREEEWKERNAREAIYVDEHLQELLEEKPHLAYAIANSKNRYQEAWDQLKGHGKVQTAEKREPVKEIEAPASPASRPKSAGVNQTIDVMGMTDKEFNEWRRKQIKRR